MCVCERELGGGGSVGDLEESIFLHEGVICGHHVLKYVWLTLTTFISACA